MLYGMVERLDLARVGSKRFGPLVVSATDSDQLRPLCPSDGWSHEGIGMSSWADERLSHCHRLTSSHAGERSGKATVLADRRRMPGFRRAWKRERRQERT